MSTEQNKAMVRRWIEEGWNKGNLALVDEIYTANVVQHDPSTPNGVTNAEDLKQYVGGFQKAMPNLHFTIDDLVAEGDTVVWRFTAHGTQRGELMGIPPSGKSADVVGTAWFRLAGGKVAEVWVNFDALGMLQQLGVIPTGSAA